MTEQELAALFAELNVRYFGGRLPGYRVRWGVSSRDTLDANGLHDGKQRTITLHKSLRHDKGQLLATFLHEMAHAASGDRAGHGDRWVREMNRLRELGAPLDNRDKQVSGPPIPFNRGYVEDVADGYLSSAKPATFGQFARILANRHLQITTSALLRRYPWVRAAFQRARKEHRENAAMVNRLRTGETKPKGKPGKGKRGEGASSV